MFVSIRDVLVPEPHGGFGSIAEGLKALGLEAIEVQVDRDMTVMSLEDPKGRVNIGSKEGLSQYRAQLEGKGVRVSAFLVGNDFGRPDVDKEVEWVVRVVEAAHELGVPAVRVDAIVSGWEELGLDGAVRKFAENVRRVLEATEGSGVALGIENHGALGNRPEFLDAVLTEVASPRLGLTLDTGNFYWFGHPLSKVYEIMRRFAPFVKHTHIKNIRYPEEMREKQREIGYEYGKFVSPIYEGDVDHALVVDILRQAGYDHDLCIEDESLGKFPPEERREVLRRDAEHLKSLI